MVLKVAAATIIMAQQLYGSRRYSATVIGQYKFNLDFGSPPGELSYYLWISSNYVSRYRVCGIFQGGWNLTSRTYSGVMTRVGGMKCDWKVYRPHQETDLLLGHLMRVTVRSQL